MNGVARAVFIPERTERRRFLDQDWGLQMRSLIFLVTVLCGLAASQAQATVLLMACKDSSRGYELRYDDEVGSLASVTDGIMSQFIIRNLKSENGSVTILGTLADRGWDFTFVYRFTPSITYHFANGGKRTDNCEITGRRNR